LRRQDHASLSPQLLRAPDASHPASLLWRAAPALRVAPRAPDSLPGRPLGGRAPRGVALDVHEQRVPRAGGIVGAPLREPFLVARGRGALLSDLALRGSGLLPDHVD